MTARIADLEIVRGSSLSKRIFQVSQDRCFERIGTNRHCFGQKTFIT